MEQIGKGQKTFDYSSIKGIWQRLEGPEDVLTYLENENTEGVIAVIRDAGATFLSPIFEDLTGVICTGGTIRSHIGIISREFQIPGVVAAELFHEPEDGTEIEIDGTGEFGIIRLPENSER